MLYGGGKEQLMADELIVIGYGGTTSLKEADFVHLEDITHCNIDVNRQIGKFKSEMIICTEGKRNDTQPITCSGDSGSPLMVRTNELIAGKIINRWSLVGLVSMGPKDCSDEALSKYTIFTNVTLYQTWINDIINHRTESMAGTYCLQDNQNQCVDCHSTYRLNNQQCELLISQRQINSIYSFFDNVYCADECSKYMKLIPPSNTDVTAVTPESRKSGNRSRYRRETINLKQCCI